MIYCCGTSAPAGLTVIPGRTFWLPSTTHSLAAVQSRVNDQIVLVFAICRNRLQGSLVGRIDHQHRFRIQSVDDSLFRKQHRIGPFLCHETDSRELSWQEECVRVRKDGAQGQRSGLWIDSPVCEIDVSVIRKGLAVCEHQVQPHRRRSICGAIFAAESKIGCLRDAEVHIHRIEAGDGRKRALLTRCDQVSSRNVDPADGALDRRLDQRVTQIQFGSVDSGLVRFERGLLLGGSGYRDVEILLRRRLLLYQRLEAGDVPSKPDERGLVLRQFGLSLLERGPVQRRLDAEKGVAFVNRRAFFEKDVFEKAGYAGYDDDRFLGFGLPHEVTVNGHVLNRYGCDSHDWRR